MIIGEGIRLRAVEKKDLYLFVTWLNDPDVRHFLELYYPLSMAFEEQWFESNLKKPVQEQPLVIEVDQKGWKPVGNISFMNIDERARSAEVGLFIGEKDLWSQGIGSKALQLMLEYGFNTLNYNRIFLRVFEDNKRGIRCYEKTGFIHEGKMRQAHFLDGEYKDMVFMSVLRKEWKGKGKK
jgi:RimJ/RimL family protein N-acetyltransferase